MTVTAAEITDTRTAVIAGARETLDRARSECLAWRGPASLRVVAAMAGLEGALRSWDEAVSEEEKDRAVRDCGWEKARLVRAAGVCMGDEAAAYVSGGEEEEGVAA